MNQEKDARGTPVPNHMHALMTGSIHTQPYLKASGLEMAMAGAAVALLARAAGSGAIPGRRMQFCQTERDFDRGGTRLSVEQTEGVMNAKAES